jgi:hypothetical protein
MRSNGSNFNKAQALDFLDEVRRHEYAIPDTDWTLVDAIEVILRDAGRDLS